MGRTPRFEAVQCKAGWRVNVPESLSTEGKREQHFFPTREKAKEFAKTLRHSHSNFGTQARAMSPGTAEDAVKALALLQPLNVSLVTAARFYVSHHDKRNSAPTLLEAWNQAITLRSNHSDRYLDDLEKWKRKLPQEFQATNIVDLTPNSILETLNSLTTGAQTLKTGLRILSAVLGDQVKLGTIKENPCSKVQLPRVKNTDAITIYTVDQLRALFAACIDYDEGNDRSCSQCAIPYAFLAFAGIRPAELTRLRWEKVKMENGYIRLDGDVTKTGKTRNVRIHATLRAWIERLPEEQRTGKIVPGRWKFKSARVKREAGLDGRNLQDALRHSYGSYMLAIEGDTPELRADFGHERWSTFYNHYHNAVTKEEAQPYWEVLPPTAAIS